MSERVLTRNRALLRGLVIGAFAVTVSGISARAQPGGGPGGGGPGGPGGGLPPEVRAKVEAAQAQAVAASLTLDAEKSGKLAEAYSAARKAAAESRPEGGGGGRGDWEAMLKAQEENRAKMQESFKAFLDEAQAKEAAAILGGNARQWDRLVAVILGFGLEEAKQAEALGHTVTYVKASVKAREDNAGSGNFEGVRTAMAAAKKTLDDAIAPLLSDAQKAEWTEKTARGPRGGGERRGEGGPGGPGAGAPGAPGEPSARERRDGQ